MSIGAYIHIPFCLTKCGYCSFFSLPFSQATINNFASVLLQEIDCFKQNYRFQPDTVYLGGGTPSLLSSDQIKAIIDALEPVEGAEITLEANPVQLTSEWLKILVKTKVNRLSLGVQTMNNHNLKSLGRKHTSQSIPDRIKLCRDNGFENISLDLLYGLPASNSEQVKADLDQYIALNPEHISAYLLSIENHVPLYYWQNMLPDETEAEKQYNTICEMLSAAGWEHYEISNFAKAGFSGKHNLHYWQGDEFIGLGAGASGYIGKSHYKRPDDLLLWQHSVEKKDITYKVEKETLAQQKADFIIMQLRLMRGLDLQLYKERFGSEFVSDYNRTIEKFIASGHLEVKEGFICLTQKAWFVSNSILQEFV